MASPAVAPTPRGTTAAPDPPAPAEPRVRDHALSLHRFAGGVQLLGGLTLISAYALGSAPAGLAAATPILIGLGILQLATGLTWLLRTRLLRDLVKRRPGTIVAATATPAITVAALGGSGPDALWVTSTEAWLAATGTILTLRGNAIIVAAGTLAATAAWIAIDGTHGGYNADGNYLTATIALAKTLTIGLWLGTVLGATWTVLDRWTIIERRERGLARRLRDTLRRIDTHAATVAERLSAKPTAATEIRTLRARLTRGVGIATPTGPITLGGLLTELAGEHADHPDGPTLQLHCSPAAAAIALDASHSAAITAVLRRQLANIARHAPAATTVTLTADRDGDDLTLHISDNGHGTPPAAPGTGTAWTTRQLDRLGGHADYYAAPHGVGLAIRIPIRAAAHLTAVPELSVEDSLTRFSTGMLAALRWASYIGDTLAATALDGIGHRWLLMPIGALVIEYAIRRGLPGRTLTAPQRRLLGSLIAVALVLIFTIPTDSPSSLVPASTSVVVLASLLVERQTISWLALELARALAVMPLAIREGGSIIELVVIYPVAFNLLAYALRRFIDRASRLERDALDATGRATLASATLHGLALRHDVVDVCLRAGDNDPALLHDAAQLEAEIDDLATLAAASLDPRTVVRAGLSAALLVPITGDDTTANHPRRSASGAIDRITLAELAALAADERASCTPPGLLGRRRLKAMHLHWTDAPDGTLELHLTAEPSLGPPDPHRVAALERVASALGVAVHSTPHELRLTYTPR